MKERLSFVGIDNLDYFLIVLDKVHITALVAEKGKGDWPPADFRFRPGIERNGRSLSVRDFELRHVIYGEDAAESLPHGVEAWSDARSARHDCAGRGSGTMHIGS